MTHRSAASRGVNTESILMSWKVGSYISARLQSNEWGSNVVTELSEYLRIQDPQIVQTASAQIPVESSEKRLSKKNGQP